MVDGHTVTVSVELSSNPTEADLRNAFETFSSVPQERNLPSAPKHPVQYMPEADRPQPRKDAERDRGMATFVGRLRPCPVFDWKFVALGHNTIRGAAGAAVLNAELMHSEGLLDYMIVMKFGGTSVESAAAIERVAAIVKARVDRHPIVVVSAMGKTTNKLLAIAQAAIEGKRDEYIRQLHDLRDFHSREARQVVPLAHRAELDRTLDDHFQEMTELVKGIAVLGELTPRSIDAISSYGERLSSYIVALAFEHFGVPSVHVDSRRVIVTDHRHTQAAPLFPETYKRLAETLPPLAQDKVVVMGGFIGVDRRGRDDHARARRFRFHRIHRRRGRQARRNPDLDRRRRHADRRPDYPSRRPSRQNDLVRRSRGTGLFRREGAASFHGDSGDRAQHSGADSEFAPARSARHAHRRRDGALHATS